jgi:hypothetical protein
MTRKVHHHYHKHPGLDHLARSVSIFTVALSIVSSVSQLISFLLGCCGLLLKGFGFVAFFAGATKLLVSQILTFVTLSGYADTTT